MKKLSLILCIVLAVSLLVACGGENNQTEMSESKATEAPTTEATEAPITKATEAPTTKATEAPTTEATEAPTTEATEAPTTKATEAPTTKATEPPTTATKPVDDKVGAEFKAAMDSYEEFMDEYVAIVKKFKANPSDFTILASYTDYMSKYTTFVADFEKWENEDMNTAELAYYIEVQSRVSKKLLEVAQ